MIKLDSVHQAQLQRANITQNEYEDIVAIYIKRFPHLSVIANDPHRFAFNCSRLVMPEGLTFNQLWSLMAL